jgi:hypothetical protein
LLERDMIAVRAADELRLVVIASRAYLEGHGRRLRTRWRSAHPDPH